LLATQVTAFATVGAAMTASLIVISQSPKFLAEMIGSTNFMDVGSLVPVVVAPMRNFNTD